MAEASASKTSLFKPRWKRRPAHPLRVCQTHAAPTSPLAKREPSVQTLSRRLHPCAVWRAPALF